ASAGGGERSLELDEVAARGEVRRRLDGALSTSHETQRQYRQPTAWGHSVRPRAGRVKAEPSLAFPRGKFLHAGYLERRASNIRAAPRSASPLSHTVRRSPNGVPTPQLRTMARLRLRVGSAQAPDPPKPKWPKARFGTPTDVPTRW